MAKPRILVVDDDVVLLEILQNVITNQMSLDCDLATNGKAALQSCEKNDYELVITDARMPEMDGLELLGILKKRCPKLDVIVMTGFTNEFSYIEVIRAGAADYISKPLGIHEIEAKISRVLRERTVMNDLIDHNARLQEDARRWLQDADQTSGTSMRRRALGAAFDLLMVVNAAGIIRECNGKVTRSLGLGPDKNLLDSVAPDDVEAFRAALKATGDGLTPTLRAKLIGEEQRATLYEISFMPLEGGEERSLIHIVARDETARMELEKRFHEERDRVNALYNSKPDALLIVERDMTISYMNGPARDMFDGLGIREGERYTAGMFGERRQSDSCIVQRTFELAEPLSSTSTGVTRYGEMIFWEERTIPILDNGAAIRVMHVLRDITELREVEAELRMLSVKDTLTDLYNRRHFCEVLEREMHRAQRQRSALCLMLLDVDGFKEYNDTRGHVAGDEVLIQLGEMLKECIREHVDSACRLGGDEFTVVLPQTSIEQATNVAQRLREKFHSFKAMGLTLSIGVAAYNDEIRVEDFVNRVDRAMYDVKHFGKDAIKVV